MPFINRVGTKVVETIEGGGGNAALAFSVKNYSTLPDTGAENEIAVISDTMSGWVMQAEEPTHAEGLVWIRISNASDVAFSAVEDNVVMVYPVGVSQSVDGSWVNREAFIYQSEWKQFSRAILLLYKYGETTFNWPKQGTITTFAESASVGGINSVQTASSTDYIKGNIYYPEKQSLSGFTKLYAIVKLNAVYGSSGVWFYTDTELLSPSSTLNPVLQSGASKRITEALTEWTRIEIDISSLDGTPRYVGFYMSTGQNLSHTLSVKEVWAE